MNILLFTVDSLTVGAIIGIVVSLVVILTFIIVICICCCNPRCPLYNAHGGYNRRGLFRQRTEPTPVVTTTVVQTTNTHQQVQPQPLPMTTTDQQSQPSYAYNQAGPPAAGYAYDYSGQPAAGYTYNQAPYGVPPDGQQFTVEQPPPYNPHDPYGQQSYPPQPTKTY